jgi:dipeptidyl-peptidase-4
MKLTNFLLIIAFVISGLNVVSQTPAKNSGDISLENIWLKYKYFPHMVRGYNPMNDGVTYTILSQGNIDLYSYKTGKFVKTLVESSAFIPKGESKALKFGSYTFSSDETKVLVATETKNIYRHSFSAEYWIYDLKTKELRRLSKNGAQRLATFSPDGSKVAFVRDNNIFYVDLQSGKEVQVTTDGEINKIINGVPDWVYEEEFSFTRAFEWSPESDKIAFIRFDESRVKEFELTIYGDLYPEHVKYKYPKAGEDNSIVSVHVYDLATAGTKTVDIGSNTDIYIPRISWMTQKGYLGVQRLNRLQNHLEILKADAATGSTSVIYSEKNKYYIDITDNLIWLNDGFLLTSERSGYNHIYRFDMSGNVVKQLTDGNYDVIEVKGLDEKKGLLYYIAAQSSPMNRDIFTVNIKSGKITKISKRDGTNNPDFSKGFKYYVNTFTDLNTPPYITINKANGDELMVLEDNKALIDRMKADGYSPGEFFKFKTDDGVELNGWMIKPANFDPHHRYPVLMYVYGGPGSQTVLNDWGWFNLFWYQMLAQKGYIVVSVDGRGTGARGEEFKKSTYLNLGELETKDQIAANRYLASLDFVDGKRIGIFGWSYGGYMSTLCMTKGAAYFKAGIAVAPVTNWRNYDNIYTERFMRTPKENGDSYDRNSPVTYVDKLKGGFLLVHGIADDNVHVQNSMELILKLVDNNKQFEMQFYPNNDHGIHNGRYTRYHLYLKMTNFILNNL